MDDTDNIAEFFLSQKLRDRLLDIVEKHWDFSETDFDYICRFVEYYAKEAKKMLSMDDAELETLFFSNINKTIRSKTI